MPPLFRRRAAAAPPRSYDPETEQPALRCSICTGEKTAGFRSRTTGRFREIMLIRSDKDLDRFRREYGVDELVTFY